MISLDRLWLVAGPAYIRLSTVITLLAVFVLVVWRFRARGWMAVYNGVVAALFTLFLYEVLFNVSGGFPPTDMLPFWGVGLLVCSMLLGLLQARNHFVLGGLSMILFSAFAIDWFVWILIGFPFNLPTTYPLNPVAEAFNVSTKLFLAVGYVAGIRERELVPPGR